MRIAEIQYLRDSSEQFIKRIFGYKTTEPHLKILEHYEQCQETLDLAPRGCGKTRIGNIGFVTWKVLNDPDLRILIISDTDTHAVRFLGTIKVILEQHPLIKQYYGNPKSSKWTDHELILGTRSQIFTEASISAMGMYSGAVTTGHYDIIIADDLINFDNSRTEGQRERSKEWFKTTLLPTLLPGGEIHCLGTRYHYNDLWQMVIDDLGYDTQIQRAIKEDGTSIWEAHMPLKDKTVNGRTIEGLETKRRRGGSIIFSLQYQNDVQLMKEGSIFRYDWFQFYDAIPENLAMYMGVDPMISQKDTADYFVIVVVGLTANGDVYVLDVLRERLTFDQQVHAIKRKHDEWKPRVTGIEKVAYQEALVQHIRSTYPALRLKGIATVKDKVSRAYMRSGLFENGKVFVRRGMHLFIDELVLFPDGRYDDQFDAFDFAMEVAEEKLPSKIMTHPFPHIPSAGPGIRI